MEDESVASLKDTHGDLYGVLMLANRRIGNVGTLLIWILGVAVLAFCVSVHMRWMDVVLGIPVDRLRGFGVYTLVAVATFLAFVIITEFREKRTYYAAKPAILNSLQQYGMSVAELLADIADDDNLSKIREQLMDDGSIQQPDQMQFL